MSFGTKIILLDCAVGVPAFVLAAYLGANLPVSLSCGFVAASFLNVIGASINLSKIHRK